MPIADDFIKFCTTILEANFGQQSSMILNGVKSKKHLNKTANISDYEDFIFLTGLNICIIAGKDKANNVHDALTEWVKKITGEQKQNISAIEMIDKEINDFLIRNELSAEEEITEFTKYLVIKYSGNAKKVENGLLREVRNHVKNVVNKKRIQKEIDHFLTKYKLPTEKDINDFIDYIHFLRINFQINELRQQIEKVRLFRKFEHDVSDHQIEVCDEKLKILIENTMINKSNKSTNSKIQDALDYFFELKGIPSESDINDIKDLILCGCGDDTKQLIDKIKQLSKEKIIQALNDSIMTGEIRSFIYKNPCYTQVDVENFINYLKVRKFMVNDDEVHDLIEKEYLFSRFDYKDKKESQKENISKQYAALFSSKNKNEYKYILEHDDNLIQLKLQLKLAKVLKKPEGTK